MFVRKPGLEHTISRWWYYGFGIV